MTQAITDIANLLPKTVAKAAEFYASRFSWRVFPLYEMAASGVCSCAKGSDCPSPGKHPRVSIPSGADAQHPATSDVDTVKKWWKKWPEANIGVWLEGSGIIVLDIDKNDKKDGFKGLADIMAFAKEEFLPKTLICDTPSGGKHLYFNFCEGVPNKANALGPGLDTWHSKHYVIVPPSNHKAGSNYKWATQDNPIDFPDWLKPQERASQAASTDPKKKGRPLKERLDPRDPEDIARIKHALAHVDNTDRDRWVSVGFALARCFEWGDQGFEIYNEWSSKAHNYDGKKTKDQYYKQSKTVPPTPITTSSIFEWAKDHPDYKALVFGGDRTYEVRERDADQLRVMTDLLNIVPHFPIYQRSSQLVEILAVNAAEESAPDFWQPKGSFTLRPVAPDQLAVRILPANCTWLKMTAKGWKPTKANIPLCSTFLNIGNWPGAKQLRAFVQHPTIREDGTLITQRGFDKASGLFLTTSMDLKVPPNPTHKDAIKALAVLTHPFAEYKWVDGSVSMAALMAALFTVGLRHLISEGVPMFAVTASRQGSGKTKLVHAISNLWFGRTMAVTPYSADHEEMKKHLSAMLMTGERIILFDNVLPSVRVNDPTLNAILTTGKATFRELGSQRMLDIDSTATFFITGNHLKVVGDMIRRTIKLQIDPGGLHPENRRFKIDPLEDYVLQHREQLLTAALTIVRAFHIAKCPAPKGINPVASFGRWSALIRNMLLWVGLDDVKETVDQSYEQDDEADDIQHLLRELYLIPAMSSAGMPSNQILPMLEANKKLKEAMHVFLTPWQHGIDHPRVVTTILTQVADIPVDGKRLRKLGAVWKVCDLE